MTAARRVFITGGTGCVGRALVAAFAEAGYGVLFQFSSSTEAARELSLATGAEHIQADLRQMAPMTLTDIDVLVNNAGVNLCDELTLEVSEPVWNDSLAVNTTAPFLLIKGVLPGMIERKWGRIINVSSIYGLRAVAGNLPYTVSKHALSGLTKTIAKEYAAMGVTCNEICPGPIESSMMARIAQAVAASEGGTPEDYLRSVRDAIPMKRFARPREVADLAVFLASEAAGYVNGASIPLDGGLTA